MSTCPTVKVVSPKSPGGFVIINESDLTPEHEIWADASVVESKTEPAASRDTPTQAPVQPQDDQARDSPKRVRQSGKLV